MIPNVNFIMIHTHPTNPPHTHTYPHPHPRTHTQNKCIQNNAILKVLIYLFIFIFVFNFLFCSIFLFFFTMKQRLFDHCNYMRKKFNPMNDRTMTEKWPPCTNRFYRQIEYIILTNQFDEPQWRKWTFTVHKITDILRNRWK